MREPRRHDLCWLSPGAATATAVFDDSGARGCPAVSGALDILAGWIAAGRPLIARRPLRAPDGRVCLGLPLPPDRGKLRLGFLADEQAVARMARPPFLGDCLDAARPEWREPLGRLDRDLRALGLEARVFGSLAWARLTGLAYLTSNSDVDLLIEREAATEPERLAALLAAWTASPGRPFLDVETLLPDGSGFSFLEYAGGAAKILVKGNSHAYLCERDELFGLRG